MNTQSEQGEGEEPPQPKKAKVELPDSAADDQSKELLGLGEYYVVLGMREL